MTERRKKQQAIVYFDGYNLYHGMRDRFGYKYKWLDLQGLSKSFLRRRMELAVR